MPYFCPNTTFELMYITVGVFNTILKQFEDIDLDKDDIFSSFNVQLEVLVAPQTKDEKPCKTRTYKAFSFWEPKRVPTPIFRNYLLIYNLLCFVFTLILAMNQTSTSKLIKPITQLCIGLRQNPHYPTEEAYNAS